MGGFSQLRSLGRFLYTQNPFYLISCGLIIYGLQVATAGGDLHTQSAVLALCMIGYSALMSLTVVAVVRWGKVWEDARSIFLVVVISHLALSTGLDLLCLDHWQTAVRLLLGGFAFSIVSTEFVLRSCRLRFPFWYRATYYSLLLTFFATPVVGGHAVAESQLVLARWLGPIFSASIACCLLLLIPAIRKGAGYVRANGTPWKWPWYPLCVFVVAVVGAGIRTHAIWMAFGSLSGWVVFEPFLLLPIAMAILVLVIEFARATGRQSLLYTSLCVAPAMLMFGLSQGGMTNLAIQTELRDYFGSAATLAMLATLGFYLYAWMLRVRWSDIAVVVSLICISLFGSMPTLMELLGLSRWTITLVAAVFYFGICLRHSDSDKHWLAFPAILSLAILQAGVTFERYTVALLLVGGLNLFSMMAIGAIFPTKLAACLRQVAATAMLVAGILMILWHFFQGPLEGAIIALVAMTVATAAYTMIVKRYGWLYLAGVQMLGLLTLAADTSGWAAASVEHSHWPIQSGLLCFVIGLTITSLKTGVHRRLVDQFPAGQTITKYRHGF